MMNAKRFSYLLYATLALQAVGCIALTILANTWLTTKAEKIVALKLDTIDLEKKQEANISAAKELKLYESTRALLEKIVPKSKDQAKAIGELLNIANEVGVTINTITFPSSELGTKGSAKSTTSTNVITQAKPVTNIPGLLGIEVSLSQIVSKKPIAGTELTYKQLLAFLEAIEKNRRTMQIKNLQVLPTKGPSGNISGYTLTLTMSLFVKP